MSGLRVALATAAIALVMATSSNAYLKFGYSIDGRSMVLRWPRGEAVRYVVGTAGVTGVSGEAFRDAVARAFATWEAVPGASLRFAAQGVTDADLSDTDGRTQLAFARRPELDRTLGATSYTIDVASGEILEADVFFNAAFPWSVAANGEIGRYDLQSIATHEIGHLAGLGHSAIGETDVLGSGRRVLAAGSTMFPIAFTAGNIDGRLLRPDDIAGLVDIYPDSASRDTGSVSGRVTRNGLGVFGAHVVAMHLKSGALIGGFTLDDSGAFIIAGIEPGPIVLRAEPLDDGDVESFLDSPNVRVDFAPAFAPRLVFVPARGNAPDVEIEVVRK